MKLDIGEAKLDHLASIVELLADDPLGQTRETTGQHLREAYVRAFNEILADPNASILVALNGEKVLACLQLNILANLTLTGTKRGLIEGVRVDKSMQGQGLGRQLVEAAIQICQDQGCAMVQLTTNTSRPDAITFYQKLGFEATHVGFKLKLNPDQ